MNNNGVGKEDAIRFKNVIGEIIIVMEQKQNFNSSRNNNLNINNSLNKNNSFIINNNILGNLANLLNGGKINKVSANINSNMIRGYATDSNLD